AIDDGVIRGIYLIDEPHHKRWSPSGNSNNHIPNADIDEMARHIESYWPNARTSVRASPRTLISYNRGRHAWRHLDEAFLMINYRKWAQNGDRTLEGFFKREVSEASKQGLGLIGSLQMLIGAPPSDQQWWPNGGAKPVGKLKLSPIEMRTYVDAFLARRNAEGVRDSNGETAVSGIMVFRWDRNNENDWDNIYFNDAISEAQSVVNNWTK
nr:hypothetical protein [Gammaproteobacteria bacterium]